MNIEQLRALRAIADYGSYDKAAKALCLSQPALSAQIKLLEAEAGEILLLRSGRKKVLSPAGRLVLAHARIVLSAMDTLKSDLASLRGLNGGSLSIATGDTVASSLLAPPLAAFARAHPGIGLHLWNRTSEETARLVREGEADLGIATLPVEAKGLVVEAWRDYGWVALKNQKGKSEGESYEAMRDDTFLVLERGTRARQAFDEALASRGELPDHLIELGGVEVQIEFALAGLGTAIIPDFSFRAEAGRGIGKATASPLSWMPRCKLGIVSRVEGSQAAAEAFLRDLRDSR
jgi:DNA-binding transcriptional LysR family regulator